MCHQKKWLGSRSKANKSLFKILICVFQYCMEEKNVHVCRNSDECADPACCAKRRTAPVVGSGGPCAASNRVPCFLLQPPTVAFYPGCVWCFCGLLIRLGVAVLTQPRTICKANLTCNKTSHTTPRSAAFLDPHTGSSRTFWRTLYGQQRLLIHFMRYIYIYINYHFSACSRWY